MVNHPNRGRRESPAANPRPEEVKDLRERVSECYGVGVTEAQDKCAELVHTSRRAWQQWEGGDRRMHPAFWELVHRKIDPKVLM